MSRRCRKELALLLAGGLLVSGSALASSLTLCGVADVGYLNARYEYDQDAEHASHLYSGLESGMHRSSRWGLRGSDDLGGGLSAIFNVEQKIDLVDAEMAVGVYRRLVLGLSSRSWGTFTAGRQENVADNLLKLTTVRGLGKASRAFGNHDDVRVNGLLKYMSPVVGGFRGGLGYAPGGAAGDGFRDWVTTGVVFADGPLRLAWAFDRQRPTDSGGVARGYSVTNWTLAASWNFGIVRVNLGYGEDRNGKLKKPGDVSSATLGGYKPVGLGEYNSDGFRSRNCFVGASVPSGPGVFGLSWSRSSSNLAQVHAASHGAPPLADATQSIAAAQYVYPLSKRARLFFYGAYGRGMTYLDGFKGRELGLGTNHVF